MSCNNAYNNTFDELHILTLTCVYAVFFVSSLYQIHVPLTLY